MDQKIKKTLYRIGVTRGLFASSLGSIMFLVIEFLGLRINNGPFAINIFIVLALAMLVFGSMFISAIPAVLGTTWLVFRVYELMENGKNGDPRIFYEGAKIGFLVGFGICVLVTITYLYRSEIWVIIFQTVIATSISVFIAGATALKIKKDIQNKALLL